MSTVPPAGTSPTYRARLARAAAKYFDRVAAFGTLDQGPDARRRDVHNIAFEMDVVGSELLDLVLALWHQSLPSTALDGKPIRSGTSIEDARRRVSEDFDRIEKVGPATTEPRAMADSAIVDGDTEVVLTLHTAEHPATGVPSVEEMADLIPMGNVDVDGLLNQAQEAVASASVGSSTEVALAYAITVLVDAVEELSSKIATA